MSCPQQLGIGRSAGMDWDWQQQALKPTAHAMERMRVVAFIRKMSYEVIAHSKTNLFKLVNTLFQEQAIFIHFGIAREHHTALFS